MAVVRAKSSPSRENHAAAGPSKATAFSPELLLLIAARCAETKLREASSGALRSRIAPPKRMSNRQILELGFS
jgi:hypothetical protein